MKPRSPKTDPQPGDVLTYRGWEIEVTIRAAGDVNYVATKGDQVKTSFQPLSEWRGWAKGARVKRLGNECYVLKTVSALCAADSEPIEGDVHCVSLRLTCESHCAGVHKKGK